MTNVYFSTDFYNNLLSMDSKLFVCYLFIIMCLTNNKHVFSFKRTHHINKNPVLLISLDGMQANKFEQYLKQNPNSNLNELIRNGVISEYMIPSFPSGMIIS